MRSQLKPLQHAPQGANPLPPKADKPSATTAQTRQQPPDKPASARSKMGLATGTKAGTKAGTKVSTKVSGDAGEDRALGFLCRAGLVPVERHYRTPGRGGGEIDLIMREPDGTLVFVEVRSRALGRFGGAAVTVGHTKQRRILLAARHYLMRWATWPPCRFDVVAIDGDDISWIKAAFDAG